jgi:IgGFc binding protein
MKPNEHSHRFLIKLACLFALIGASIGAAQATNGATEFWLAPPDVTDLNNPPGGVPINFVVMSSGAASTVTIDQPANGSFTPIVINVMANASMRTDLTPFKSMLETRPTNTINNTGLHIVATTPISAYYEIANTNNTGMQILKGPDALGQEFYIPLQKSSQFSNDPIYASPHQAFASFEIVATQAGTQVTIYSPVPVDGHPALTQFSINLNRGQTYSAGFTGTNWQLPSNHPSGAVVLADKPIAVSIKDDSVHNPSGSCTSLLSEQIVPVSAVGSDYIAVKGSLNATGDESVVIIATRNGTQISVNAATPIATLFAGEYYRVDMDNLFAGPDNAVYIHASQPIYAAHISGFGCKMGMALLPQLGLGGSQDVQFVRDDAQTFSLMLVSPASAVNAFTISGPGTATITPASFLPVPGTGGAWMAARIQYNTTEVPVDAPLAPAFHVSNSAGYFALGIINGGATTGARYGYLSRFTSSVGFTATVQATPAALPAPGGLVTFNVHVTNVGDDAADLTALTDNFHGDIDGSGTCTLPQTIAPTASYDCSFALNVSGNVGDVQTETITASGTSHATSIAANGSATVTLNDVIFADGFQ